MRTGLLRGRDHTLLGAIAVLAERRVAIALSRGGAPKTYAHREPNEDAAAFAWSEHALLVAVADGHWGAGGAALALERILGAHAPRWTAPAAPGLGERWPDEAIGLALELDRALAQAHDGRATLALCLVRPADDDLLGLCVGDSHLFRVAGTEVRELCALGDGDRPVFLGGDHSEPAGLAAGCRAMRERVGRGGAVLLATDGLSEEGIGVDDPLRAAAESARAAGAAAAELAPLGAARHLCETALAAQRSQRSGDNVATACVWLQD